MHTHTQHAPNFHYVSPVLAFFHFTFSYRFVLSSLSCFSYLFRLNSNLIKIRISWKKNHINYHFTIVFFFVGTSAHIRSGLMSGMSIRWNGSSALTHTHTHKHTVYDSRRRTCGLMFLEKYNRKKNNQFVSCVLCVCVSAALCCYILRKFIFCVGQRWRCWRSWFIWTKNVYTSV